LPVLGWTIKQKKRSLWWILITLIPFGWIGFLFLSDKELNKAKERMEQLQAKIIDLNNSPRSVKHWDMVISDAKSLGLELPFSNAKSAVKKLQQDIDDLEKELKELREKYPQLVLEVKPSTNRWGRARQALCCVGIIAVVVVMVFAANYDLPVIGEYSELVFPEATRSAGLLRVEIKDYSNAPLWVRIGSEHNLIPAYLGVFLLYGALKK